MSTTPPKPDRPTPDSTPSARPDPPPAHRLTTLDEWLAYGLGTGLSPRAPGTVASAAAAVFHFFTLAHWPILAQGALVAVAFLLGIVICHRVERRLGEHDSGAIVWDEFVGIWLTLLASDGSITATLAGFVLFRLFDILKPWPISWLDRHVQGGFGVMVDDAAAGIAAAAVLLAGRYALG